MVVPRYRRGILWWGDKRRDERRKKQTDISKRRRGNSVPSAKEKTTSMSQFEVGINLCIFQLGNSMFNPISLLPGHIGPKMEWVGTQVASEKNWEEVELAQSPMHILQVVAEKGVVGPLAPYAASRYVASCNRRQVRKIPFPLSLQGLLMLTPLVAAAAAATNTNGPCSIQRDFPLPKMEDSPKKKTKKSNV